MPKDLGALADHTSERERAATEIEYQADDICAAWLLERTLFDRGWEEPFPGEITGMIGSGLFVRFGEVFEGFLPARRLQSDYYELNDLGTALVGRRGGRRYRLGDEIEVKVEDIRRAEGKVEVSSPGSGEARGEGRRGRPSRRPIKARERDNELQRERSRSSAAACSRGCPSMKKRLPFSVAGTFQSKTWCGLRGASRISGGRIRLM